MAGQFDAAIQQALDDHEAMKLNAARYLLVRDLGEVKYALNAENPAAVDALLDQHIKEKAEP